MITDALLFVLVSIIDGLTFLLPASFGVTLPAIGSSAAIASAMLTFNAFMPLAEFALLATIGLTLMPPAFLYFVVMTIYKNLPVIGGKGA